MPSLYYQVRIKDRCGTSCLWVPPPTKMDESEPIKEGYCATFGNAGARIEMPSCSLCMGNQAQVRERGIPVSL
jgi:aconitate hydratase 2 / 2-methylisocitrate dehydratase